MTVDLEAIRKRLYNLQAEMAENPFDSFTVEAMQEVVADASALADEVERLEERLSPLEQMADDYLRRRAK